MLVKLTFNGFIYMTVAGTFYVWGLPTDPLLVTLWSLVGIIGLVLTIVVLNNMQDALPGEAPR